ncbi:hypothetical protein H920_13434 [Fukomys damarensis]|uniref:Uncharacterized protein n=1 Tax=Fukomys damarensis TaxID=885580 RepID=A0A091D433_FUKDA|nr:hypothetical protein H920_13434 [Fukomys damarensis]
MVARTQGSRAGPSRLLMQQYIFCAVTRLYRVRVGIVQPVLCTCVHMHVATIQTKSCTAGKMVLQWTAIVAVTPRIGCHTVGIRVWGAAVQSRHGYFLDQQPPVNFMLCEVGTVLAPPPQVEGRPKEDNWGTALGYDGAGPGMRGARPPCLGWMHGDGAEELASAALLCSLHRLALVILVSTVLLSH